MNKWTKRILTQLSLLALIACWLVPAESVAKGNKHLLGQAQPTRAELKAVDWVLHRPDKHRRVTGRSWPELIKVRTPEGVYGSGVFARGMGMIGINTWQNKPAAPNKWEQTRELFFDTAGKHQQTNLISEKKGIETTRVFRSGKWHHTTTRFPGGKAVHYTPRTGSKPRPGIY